MSRGTATLIAAAVRLLDTRTHEYPRFLVNAPCKWPWSLLGWRKEVVGWHIGDITVEGQRDCLMTREECTFYQRDLVETSLSRIVATLATAR